VIYKTQPNICVLLNILKNILITSFYIFTGFPQHLRLCAVTIPAPAGPYNHHSSLDLAAERGSGEDRLPGAAAGPGGGAALQQPGNGHAEQEADGTG